MSGGAIETIRCADYTLEMSHVRKTAELVSGFGGNCAGSGADEEPRGSAADAAPGVAAAGDAHRVVAFVSERGAFLAFIGELAGTASTRRP